MDVQLTAIVKAITQRPILKEKLFSSPTILLYTENRVLFKSVLNRFIRGIRSTTDLEFGTHKQWSFQYA
nr:hypothetical protein Q903MT_gene409 [Picea sitchensis]